MKKKKEKIVNIYAEKYEQLVSGVLEAQQTLKSKTIEVITKKGVISLYPEVPDQYQAISDCQKAQHSLICAIGNLDSRISEIKNYYTINFDKIKEENYMNPDCFANSHSIIENTYKNYYRI